MKLTKADKIKLANYCLGRNESELMLTDKIIYGFDDFRIENEGDISFRMFSGKDEFELVSYIKYTQLEEAKKGFENLENLLIRILEK